MNLDAVSEHALSLSLAGFTFVLVLSVALLITLSTRREFAKMRRVEAVVVDFESRYDEGYKRNEDYPVVEYTLDGSTLRATVSGGFWRTNGRPDPKLGQRVEAFINPHDPRDAQMRASMAILYVTAPVVAFFTGLIAWFIESAG